MAWGDLGQPDTDVLLFPYLLTQKIKLRKPPKTTPIAVPETPSITSTPGVHQNASAVCLVQAVLQGSGNEPEVKQTLMFDFFFLIDF